MLSADPEAQTVLSPPSLLSALHLRPATEADGAHFEAVYASTREEELALTGWGLEQKAQFCRQQFSAQTVHYRQHYPSAQISVIEYAENPAGRLYVERAAAAIDIIDIALLPAYRGLGIGTALLTGLQQEARAAGQPLRIYVEKFNRALALYRRLGFVIQSEGEIYLSAVWQSPA